MKPKWFTRRVPASLPGFFAVVLSVGALLGTPAAAAAQEGAIAGQLTAITGENLVGVQVFIPGTSFGTLTDDAGRYRITGVPAGDYTLRASIIGYQGSEQPVTVTAGEVATVDFVLDVSAVALDEVVATITGERRRRELSTDISTIDANVVADNTRTNTITGVLRGQATGVFVRQNSGTVGGGSDVRIRGTGSISLSNQPLYVVDGAIIDAQPNDCDAGLYNMFCVGGQSPTRVNDLNPDEIESVEVIKGPAASALWGARGNAGVIVITTKKGAAQTRWNIRADLGQNEDRTEWPVVAFNPAVFGFPTDTMYVFNLMEDGYSDQPSPLSTGFYQNYNGNVSGGAGIWNYFGSAQYLNEKGVFASNNQERFNFRANFGVDPSSKFNLSFSNAYSSGKSRIPENDNNGNGFIGNALLSLPEEVQFPTIDPVTGESIVTCAILLETSKATGVPVSELGECVKNPTFSGGSFEQIANQVNEFRVERYTGSGNATWTPNARWINRFTLGYDMYSNRTALLTPVDPERPFGTGSLGSLTKPFLTSRNLTMQGTTTYLQPITSALDFEFVGGVQWFRQTRESNLVSGQVFPATGPAVNNAVNNQATDAFDEVKSIGFFVQGQFDVDDRLFVTGAVRWDNNSASGENLGVQTYPKFGASYVAIESGGFLSMLKIRGAWGQSGKLPGTNDAKALLATTQVALDGTDQLGVSPLRPGNVDLSPETGTEWEIGFDMAMWSDRLGLTFSYYDQKTENTVVQKNLAPSLGFPNPVFTNIGQIDNRGFEVELDALVLDIPKFSWDWRFIVTNNTNVISKLDDPIIRGDQRHQKGLPFAAFVDRQVTLGADGEAEVVTCDDTPGTWGPDDTPGEREDFCDPLSDRRYLGSSVPSFEGSAQTTLRLFDYIQIFALLDVMQGQHLNNLTNYFICRFSICPEIQELNADGTATDNAKQLQLIQATASSGGIWDNGAYTDKADWAKLRTVQLRIDLPQNWLRSLSLTGVSLSFTGENLATWTSYSGTDPEISFGSTTGNEQVDRTDFLTLPPNRRFIGTISLFF